MKVLSYKDTMMSTLFITFVYDNLPIENKFIKNLVLTYISALVIYLINYIKDNYKNILKYFDKKEITSIYINKLHYYYELNKDYEILSWYIYQQPLISGNFLSYSNKKDNQRIMIPYNGSEIFINFNNHKIKIYKNAIIKSNGTCNKEYPYYKLTLMTNNNIQILKDFIKYISKEQEKYLLEQEWEQKNFNLITIDNQLEWDNGMLTNNCRNLSTVILDNTELNYLKNDISIFKTSEEKYKKLGLVWKRGYMFYGDPGCGKTSLIKAISNELMYNIYNINLSLINDDITMNKIFNSIPTKSLIIFEDIDCQDDIVFQRESYVEVSSKISDSDKIKKIIDTKTLSNLLNNIDGIVDNHGRVIIMTSNHPKKLDPALIRPGRIDVSMELKKCSKEQIKKFFKLFYNYDIPIELMNKFKENYYKPSHISSTLLSLTLEESIKKFFN